MTPAPTTNILAAAFHGIDIAVLTPGCVRAHRIATQEEIQEDNGPKGCSGCHIEKEPEEFYTRTNGKKMTVCKVCFKKNQNEKRTAARRAGE